MEELFTINFWLRRLLTRMEYVSSAASSTIPHRISHNENADKLNLVGKLCLI